MWTQDEKGGEGEQKQALVQERDRERWGENRRSTVSSFSKSGPILPDEVAFVGKDVEFKGVISYSGTVRIDGALEGEIQTDGGLLVGPEAVLKAKITAGAVVCHGTIWGDIEATTQIVLCAPAVVEGSLTTPVLSMEEGVRFNGKLEMKPQAKAETSRDVEDNVISIESRPSAQRLAA